VRPLKALFDKFVRPGAPVKSVVSGFACVLHEWPTGERAESELRQLREANPALRVYAAHPSSVAASEATLPTLRHLHFLPDGMVLEGEWQQERELARRME